MTVRAGMDDYDVSIHGRARGIRYGTVHYLPLFIFATAHHHLARAPGCPQGSYLFQGSPPNASLDFPGTSPPFALQESKEVQETG
jgi:hypothetical protein